MKIENKLNKIIIKIADLRIKRKHAIYGLISGLLYIPCMLIIENTITNRITIQLVETIIFICNLFYALTLFLNTVLRKANLNECVKKNEKIYIQIENDGRNFK